MKKRISTIAIIISAILSLSSIAMAEEVSPAHIVEMNSELQKISSLSSSVASYGMYNFTSSGESCVIHIDTRDIKKLQKELVSSAMLIGNAIQRENTEREVQDKEIQTNITETFNIIIGDTEIPYGSTITEAAKYIADYSR